MARSVKVTLEADPAKFTTGIEPCKRSVEDFSGQLSRLDLAIKKLPDVHVNAETTDAELHLAALRKEMVSLKDEKLGITINDKLAIAQITRIRAELAALAHSPESTFAVRFNARQAGAELDKLAKDLVPDAQRMGDRLGQTISKRATGSMKEGMSSPGMWQTLGPVLAAAAIPAGVAVGGALLTGIGLAGIGAGIAGQLHDPAVLTAAHRLGTDVSAGFKDATSSFAAPLAQALRELDRDWAKLQPGIKATFTQLSPLVLDLERGAAGFVASLVPGLQRAALAARPLVKDFAAWLPQLGGQLAGVFDSLASHQKEFLFGLHMVEGGLSAVATSAHFAIDVFGKLGAAMDWMRKWGPYSQFFNAASELVVLTGHGERLIKTLGGDADAFSNVAGAENKVADATAAMNDRLTRSITDMMGLQDATLAWHMDLTGLKGALDKSGRSLDINSAAGQHNISTLQQLAHDAERVREAAIAQAGGQNASAAAVAAANKKYNAQIDELEALAVRLGLSRSAVRALLDQYKILISLPNITKVIKIVYSRSGEPLYAQTTGGRAAFAQGGTVIPAANGLAYGAGIYPASNPPLIKFAEPQTRGETLIPNYGIPAARGLALADYAASRYGGRVFGADDMSSLVAAAVGAARSNAVTPQALASAVRVALAGVTVTLDGRAVGRIQGTQADLLIRGG